MECVEAVKGVNLQVIQGEIFGFLGPNGAGKSTTLDMLTTLLTPTSGSAKIAGFDLLTESKKVRQLIGYVSQVGGTDSTFNAYENLFMQARLYGLDKIAASNRVNYLIDRFQMHEYSSRIASSYSGGQKRRLELALGIVHSPMLVFLDEPTTGLDPQSRAHFWQEIQNLKMEGMTVFLTTHYLEEADNLCDRISIIDHGCIIETDTPANMKKQIGSESISIGFSTLEDVQRAKDIFSEIDFIKNICEQDDKLTLFVTNGSSSLSQIVQMLSAATIPTKAIGISQPSLDDVFLYKTGRSLRESKN